MHGETWRGLFILASIIYFLLVPLIKSPFTTTATKMLTRLKYSYIRPRRCVAAIVVCRGAITPGMAVRLKTVRSVVGGVGPGGNDAQTVLEQESFFLGLPRSLSKCTRYW